MTTRATMCAVTALLVVATRNVAYAAGPNDPISHVYVTLYTETDDKDKEEEITIRVFYGKLIVGEGKYGGGGLRGGGDRWPDQSQQTFSIPLCAAIPLSKSGLGHLYIEKSCHGSPTGCGWDMSVQVSGRLPDGSKAELLSRTDIVRLGDNNPIKFEWPFSDIPAVFPLALASVQNSVSSSARGTEIARDDRVSIIKKHLVDRWSAEKICDECGVTEDVLSSWEQALFDNGKAALSAGAAMKTSVVSHPVIKAADSGLAKLTQRGTSSDTPLGGSDGSVAGSPFLRRRIFR